MRLARKTMLSDDAHNLELSKDREYSNEELKSRRETILLMCVRALHQNKFEAAEKILRKGIHEFQPFNVRNPALISPFYHHLAMVLTNLGKIDEGVKIAETSLAIQDVLYPDNDVARSKIRHDLAFLFQRQGDYESSIAMFEEAYKLYPKRADGFYQKGFMHMTMGNDEEAVTAFKKYLDLYDRDDAREKGNVASACCNLGTLTYKPVEENLTKARASKQTRIMTVSEHDEVWEKSVALLREAAKFDPTDKTIVECRHRMEQKKALAEKYNLIY